MGACDSFGHRSLEQPVDATSRSPLDPSRSLTRGIANPPTRHGEFAALTVTPHFEPSHVTVAANDDERVVVTSTRAPAGASNASASVGSGEKTAIVLASFPSESTPPMHGPVPKFARALRSKTDPSAQSIVRAEV